MKLLVLTKRQYTGKDLLDDRYGRMWELPKALAEAGWRVRGMALSYRNRPGRQLTVDDQLDLAWQSQHSGSPPGTALPAYWRQLARTANDFKPDLIWAGSDVFHVFLGVQLGSSTGIPVVADLYDNFESFPASRLIPGTRRLFRRALSKVRGISCVSVPLMRKLAHDLGDCPPVQVVENGVDTALFKPMDRNDCRRRFQLQQDCHLVGTAGALTTNRGIHILADACRLLRERGLKVKMAVAGPRDRGFRPLDRDDLFDLQVLPHAAVPAFLNALDVAVIPNLDSSFGRFCFPMKLYETLACGVPVAAASVGAVSELLAADPRCLYDPDDAHSLATVIERQLKQPIRPKLPLPSWGTQAAKLEELLLRITSLH
jgi:glycosyltransferase involved in cell wall biosynthesis